MPLCARLLRYSRAASVRDLVVDPPLLGQRHEQRTGAGVDLQIGPQPAQRARVLAAADRSLGGDDADLAVAGGARRRLRTGLDDADDRNVVAPLQRVERHRGRRVAGHHQQLDALVDQELGVLERVAAHDVGRLGAVRDSGRCRRDRSDPRSAAACAARARPSGRRCRSRRCRSRVAGAGSRSPVARRRGAGARRAVRRARPSPGRSGGQPQRRARGRSASRP